MSKMSTTILEQQFNVSNQANDKLSTASHKSETAYFDNLKLKQESFFEQFKNQGEVKSTDAEKEPSQLVNALMDEKINEQQPGWVRGFGDWGRDMGLSI